MGDACGQSYFSGIDFSEQVESFFVSVHLLLFSFNWHLKVLPFEVHFEHEHIVEGFALLLQQCSSDFLNRNTEVFLCGCIQPVVLQIGLGY